MRETRDGQPCCQAHRASPGDTGADPSNRLGLLFLIIFLAHPITEPRAHQRLPPSSPSAAADLKAGAAFYKHSHQRSSKHTRIPSLPGHGPTSTPAGPAVMDEESSARLRATPPHPTSLKPCSNKGSDSQPLWLLFPALLGETSGGSAFCRRSECTSLRFFRCWHQENCKGD